MKKVRAFFRHLVCWHYHSFKLAQLQGQLSLDKESALALAAELQTQGYIKPPEGDLYTFTDKGEELVRASAAGGFWPGASTVRTSLGRLGTECKLPSPSESVRQTTKSDLWK
jgi:hypothetical protein